MIYEKLEIEIKNIKVDIITTSLGDSYEDIGQQTPGVGIPDSMFGNG